MKTVGKMNQVGGEMGLFIKLTVWFVAITAVSFAISAGLDWWECEKQPHIMDNATGNATTVMVNYTANCSLANYMSVPYVWGIYTQANADLNEIAEMEDRTGVDWLMAFLKGVAQGVVYLWVFVLLYTVLFSRVLGRALLGWAASVLVGLLIIVYALKLDGLLNLMLSFIP